jgi:hypothetical protein
MLWKHIKNYWLNVTAWKDVKTLKQAVLDILLEFGKEYKIDFIVS